MTADRVRWGQGRRNAFKDWAHYEIKRASTGRSQAEKDWRGYIAQYRPVSEDQSAHFPFEGAHKFTVPVTAMMADPILAMYMGNIHQAPNIWSIQPLNEQWINVAKPLQDGLTWLDEHLLKMWDVNLRTIREMIILGTGVYKTHWIWEARNVIGYDENLRRQRQQRILNRPAVDHVTLQDFLVPPEAKSTEPDDQGGAQWVAERHRMRPAQLRAMARGQAPFLPNYDPEAVEVVMGQIELSLTDHHEEALRLERTSGSPSQHKESQQVEIWEVHARFDTSGNGVEDDVIVHFHQPTSTILRAVYNWMPSRPYDVIRYLRGDGFYGKGVGEQASVWQSLISNVLNFDLDKLLLSHSPMWAAREGSNILPDEPIFPGKIWYHNDKDDIPTPLHFLSPGNFDIMQMMAFLQQSSQNALGISELQLGGVSQLPSRTPATTISSMLQQSHTRFDMSIKDIRMGGLSNVGLKLLQHLQFQSNNFANNPLSDQYPRLFEMILGMPEGQAAASAISVPNQAIEFGIGIQLTATSGTNNKELEKQNKLALLQLAQQMAPGFIQLAQLVTQDPGGPVGSTALQLFQGGAELLRQVMEQFDVRNPEEFIPNIQALLGAQQALSAGQQISPLAGALGGQGAPQFG